MPKCSVCSSPARAQIEAALVGGTRQVEIAATYGFTQPSVSRHLTKHMDESISLAKEQEIEPLELTGLSLEGKLDALCDRAALVLARAEKSASTDTQFRGLGEMRKLVELMAKLAGQIADTHTTVQLLQVIVNDGSETSRTEPGRTEQLLLG